ncbi:hypothetical protein [Burkholderia sp. IMCC1007]|uniref:hypothetical protein n=1 Tax=Burkholderia sp. IMCC1007 TaxID=3004104 RepID=UPI0022B2BD0A|nr:hypothetical protein [Burkholderia sp. IMCC1007]
MRAPVAILLRAGHSHLYPGCIVAAADMPVRFAASHPAMIEFADGSGATATLSQREHDAVEPGVDEYVTSKRHTVVARRWLLHAVDATRTAWRVARRLPGTLPSAGSSAGAARQR